jgi:hypothetical protein
VRRDDVNYFAPVMDDPDAGHRSPAMTLPPRALLVLGLTTLLVPLALVGCPAIPEDGGAVGIGGGAFFFAGAISGGNEIAKSKVLAVDTGANRTLEIGVTTTLLGIVSGGQPPYSFLWDVVGGPEQTLREPLSPVTTLTTTNLGDSQYRLTVTDFAGARATSDVLISVVPAQLPTGLVRGPG